MKLPQETVTDKASGLIFPWQQMVLCILYGTFHRSLQCQSLLFQIMCMPAVTNGAVLIAKLGLICQSEAVLLVTAFTSAALACRLGAYELHDLVVLDQNVVGVIISIAKDSCKVLTNRASVVALPYTVEMSGLGVFLYLSGLGPLIGPEKGPSKSLTSQVSLDKNCVSKS